METITFTKKEYSELISLRDRLDRLLAKRREKTSFRKDGFLAAFGVLKEAFKGDSLDYVTKLRKEWRK